MPILPLETDVFPDDLFENGMAQSPYREWFAIYSKPRQEKALARRLLECESPFYLPLVPKDNLIRGRRVRSHIPLFTGYVFLFGNEEEHARVLATRHVCFVLPVEDQEQLWSDLRQLRYLIDSGAPLTIERRLTPGRRVCVKDGPFVGLEGTVTSRRGECRLLVAVDFLQQGASIAIEDFLLEPIDGLYSA